MKKIGIEFAIVRGTGSTRADLRCLTASEREPQRCADFLHPSAAEAGYTLAQSCPRDGDCVVQVHGATAFHPVVQIQYHLRRHVSNCGGDGRHGHGGKMADGAVASEHENRQLLAGRRKSAKVNIAAAQWGGRPRARRTAGPAVRLRRKADEGVGRGPGVRPTISDALVIVKEATTRRSTSGTNWQPPPVRRERDSPRCNT